jgi:hypothetical protein
MNRAKVYTRPPALFVFKVYFSASLNSLEQSQVETERSRRFKVCHNLETYFFDSVFKFTLQLFDLTEKAFFGGKKD